jgi:hypothetical protein
MFTSLVACRGFFNCVAFVMETTKHTFWAILMACEVSPTAHVTGPDHFHRNLLPLGKRKKIVCNMVRNILDKAPGLLHKLGLGFLVKVWARRVRSTRMMAHHDGMKLFTSSLLVSPWVGRLVTFLMAIVVMATLHVAYHGLTPHLQFLDGCRLRHRTFEMASKIVPTAMVARLSICHRGVEEIALCRDTLKWALKLGACFNAGLVLVAFLRACFDLLPSGLLRQVLVKEIVNHLLD